MRVRTLLSGVVLYLLVAALLALPAWGATQNALVTGSVFDQNGAPVSGATVRLINAGIGFAQTQSTDSSGIFTFTNVPPAQNYIISVEMSGFATMIRPGLAVAVDDAKLALPPFLLQPAAQPGEQIEQATSEVPTVAPELVSTTLGGVVGSTAVRTLPLANRDFLDLALLTIGTYPVEQGSALEGASLVVNGVRADMNNFLLDGADNNDYTINQSLPFQIVEALQEFRVQASTSNAEFGRNAGAQINSVSRSGSNDLHGTLFWFNRNSALSAKQPISAYRGGTFDAFAQGARVDQIIYGPGGTFFPEAVLSDPALRSTFDEGRDPGLNQNQFGANLGGPLVQDKAFFFFNWESFRAANNRPTFERVPDLFFRQGLFVDPLDPAFPSLQLASDLLNLYPSPNVPASTVTDAFGFPISDPEFGDFGCALGFCTNGAFAVGSSENFTNSDNFLERIDIRPTGNIQMSFKHNIQRIEQVQGGSVAATSSYPGNGVRLTGRNQNFSYNYLHTISAQTVNEFRFGWTRFRLTTLPLDSTLNASNLFQNLNFNNKGLPTFLLGGYDFTLAPYAHLGADFSAPSNRADNVWSFADNLSYTWGRHVLKLGAEYRHNRLNVTNEALGRGLLSFFSVPFGVTSGLPDLASIARVSPEFGGGFDRSFSANSFDWFVQDTWRPRSNVSLTYGLRYEINGAPREARDRLVNNYPGACAQLVCLIRSGDNTIYDTDGTSLGTASFTAPRAGFKTDYNNLSPHLGLAWDPWGEGKTVFRGGYAITFDQQAVEASVNMLANPPFVEQWASFYPFFELGDTFPTGFPTLPFDFFDLDGNGVFSAWFQQPYSITARDPKTRTSYVHQFHLGVQQQVGSNSLFEVAYVGSAGHKLPRLRLQLECTQDILINPATAFECLPPAFGTGAFSDSVVNQENTGNSIYHSLQLRWETNDYHGMTFRLNYAWAHSIDTASSANAPVFFFSPTTAALLSDLFSINADQFAGLNTVSPTLSLRPGLPIITTRPLLPSNSTNGMLDERASSDFDVRHRLVLDYIYQMPTWAPVIGEGWTFAGITTLQSGRPFTVYVDYFGLPLRPSFRNSPTLNRDNPDRALDGATVMGFADSAFGVSNAVQALPGDTGRNAFTGSKLINFDFSILKNTYLGANERVNLQFRVEFFNLFNNVNFRQPFSQGGIAFNDPFGGQFFIPNPFYGQVLQAYAPREVQFGLKLIF